MNNFFALVLPLIIALAGCQDKKAGTNDIRTDNTILKSGVFVDSNVSGINYVSGNTRGITSDGIFLYEEGENIVFGIGSLNFGFVAGSDLVTPNDFIYSLSIARLLQTLDDDSNPENGIVIPESVQNSPALAGAGSLLTDIESQESKEIIAELTSLTTAGVRDVVSIQDAKAHMEKYTSYASIDKNVTSKTVHKSTWDTNYGYNQYYGHDLLQQYPTLPNYHAGMDISTPNGTSIYSLTSGTVSRIKDSIGAVYIKPDNQDGTIIYMHLSDIDVNKDDVITQGMKIGKSGKKGTGSYHLHIEWIKDGTYNKDEESPSVPNEISSYNQGTTTTITDVTYDLKDLEYPVDSEEGNTLEGVWVSSATQIPLADTSTFTKTLSIGKTSGTFSVKYTQDVFCGYLVAEQAASIDFVVSGNNLTATFADNMPSYRDECSDFWVETGSYSTGDKIHFKRVKMPNGGIVLKEKECAYNYNGACVMDSQPYIKQ
ncbi:hypothetical protein GQR58_010649 [Nymphon striatum]|nr:hypothetical protein GQR58_010649 [Nymphon striatum]